MLSKEVKEKLEGQHYKIIGEHSAVKTCTWTKKSLFDKGSCYKEKFYGISSHRCCQMTPSLVCCNSCIYCWRSINFFNGTKLNCEIDNANDIIENAIKGQRKLLNGFPGDNRLNKEKFKEAQDVKHFAISLIGEPLIYLHINELISNLHKKNISTFLVSNGQYPDSIKNLKQVAQLYLSLDAPNKELYKKIDIPMFKDYWERINESLENLSKRKERTCIRLTLIKDVNMINPEEYASLIKKANPSFIEVKAYMHVGYSRKNLEQENMPFFEDILEFSKILVKFLEDYEILDEHKSSRVVLIAKKIYNKKIKIDFDKFFKLVNSKEIKVEDYLR